MDKTMAMPDNNTRPLESEENNRFLLKNDIIIEGKNDKYEISVLNRIGLGGESQVYLARRVSNNEQVVAKIYDQFTDNHENRSNRKKIIDFLNKNSDYKNSHIMPLLDYGKITIESDDDEPFIKNFDIIPYCKDGELKKCDYKTLKNKIIPEILHALNLLHTSGIVHRDIKPNNIYMLNGDVVIADFGTSGEISTNNKYGYIGTQKRRGTIGYTAPEIDSREIVMASDYYSLGCTIATLYKGEHVYQSLVRMQNDFEVKKSIKINGLPLDCPADEADLQILVNALVMTDYIMRAGYNDVNNWIANSQSFISNWNHKPQNEEDTSGLGFKFQDTICNDAAELTNAMMENWEKAKEYLYRGGENNSAIVRLFSNRNPNLSHKAMDIIEVGETARNHDLGLAQFLHHLNTTSNPNCPIYWCGNKFGKLSDISIAISENERNENIVISMLNSKFLSWRLENCPGNYNTESINAIKEVEDIAEKFPKLGYYTFMFRFDPKRHESKDTVDTIFGELVRDNINWYKKAEEFLKNDKILAQIIDIGYKNAVLSLKKEITGKFISDDNISDLNLLYLFFETVCSNKLSVREHYLHHGPQAYLYWFQQNLGLYSFNSPASKEIEMKIKNIRFDSKMEINEISRNLLQLRTYLRNDFMPIFQNNYLLSYIGLNTENIFSGITTSYTYAFFAGNFFNIKVPVGYLKSIGQ